MPFIMSPINTRVVRRSNALMDHRYGKSLTPSPHLRLLAHLPSAGFAIGINMLLARLVRLVGAVVI